MFPGIYEFHWDVGHLVFLGGFFLILIAITTTLSIVGWRAMRGQEQDRASAMRWEGDFASIPRARKPCRHALAGECADRICMNGFDCGNCGFHHVRIDDVDENNAAEPVRVYGIPIDPNRSYHRGHTWVEEQDDGTVLVGLDGFASRILGPMERVELPPPGTQLHANDEAWRFHRHGHAVRVLAPLRGEVLEVANGEAGWFLRLGPGTAGIHAPHLLRGDEARAWIEREVESLQARISPGAPMVTLADGGEMNDDLPAINPDSEWDSIWADYFLEA